MTTRGDPCRYAAPRRCTGSASTDRKDGLMHAIGIFGSIEFDGNWLVIKKRPSVFASTVTREIALVDITSVTYKRATRFTNGFFQITLAGTPASPIRRKGAGAGRPALSDLDSLSFRRRHNREFEVLDEEIRTARRAVRQA
jgi:hypothetical protein